MQEHFQIFARYNAWANRKIYTVIGRLPEEALARERPAAYFGSILGTLNHILVGDKIWMGRFEGSDSGIKSLDQVLHEDLEGLDRDRREEDRRIIAFTDRMRPQDYERKLAFRTLKGEAGSGTYGQLFSHLFNHQTHHRGQLTTLLTQAGHDVGVTDLPRVGWPS